ncbi:MAG: 1-acyl-sn-glycerol-3-phosphate acyltransferase [Deltaproteobacteria bacterium]|nr:1-acyl-sn-glycerol-3-phosphate acyltransferase [Deltaproteobacteria bacterium]
MKKITKFLLYLQNVMGRLAIFVIGPLIFLAIKLMRYKVRDLNKTRKMAQNLFKKHRGPWMICPNHLTMIDSVVLAYAIAPLHGYMLNYRILPWNLPESANFQSNIFLAVICYLAKCIPISRGGDRREMKSTMDKCAYLLENGESLLIFPEGRRSRTGRVDTENFSYGVGRLIANATDCRVMCVYLRGDGQKTYSNIPRFGEHFTIRIETFSPDMENRGLKAQRSCARQIVERLSRMEQDYFDRQ